MKTKFDIFTELFYKQYEDESMKINQPPTIIELFTLLKSADRIYEGRLAKEEQEEGYIHTPPPIESKSLILYFMMGAPILDGIGVRNTKFPVAIVAANNFEEAKNLIKNSFVSTSTAVIGTKPDCNEPHILYKFNIQQF